MFDRLTQYQWLPLPWAVKEKLASIFNINRTGFTHVADGRLVEDGYSNEDLAVVTKARIDAYLTEQGIEVKGNDINASYEVLVTSILDEIKKKEEENAPIQTIQEAENSVLKDSLNAMQNTIAKVKDQISAGEVVIKNKKNAKTKQESK